MMLTLIVAAALQAAAPAQSAAANEAAARQGLIAKGMSKAGVDTMVAVQKKHEATIRSIAQRGRTAEQGIAAALAKRPIDAEGFVTSNTARGEAVSALQRETIAITNEQMRALSPADRVVVATIAAQQTRPAGAAPKR